MIRAVVVDDEPLARKRVLDLLARAPDVNVVAECGNGAEAIEAVRAETPEVLFLDIQMPETDGFSVLASLRPEEIPAVVFISAFDEHAIRAFEAHALDYLLKPFADGRFEAALDRIREEVEKSQARALSREKILGLREAGVAGPAVRIPIKSSGRTYFVAVDDIDWIQGAGVYAEIHAAGTVHLARASLTELERRLDPERFVRIHRSTIVAIRAVEELRSASHGDYTIVLRGGATVRMSRRYRDRCAPLFDL